jgi:predicted dehydrogenase
LTAETLRVGVIGAGAIATSGHIPGLQRLGGVEVAAVCDANVGRAKEVSRRFGVPGVYGDYREMLTGDVVDAVTVAVPNALHASIVLASLKAGKHVLCEKPLATSPADAEAMVEAAESAGLLLAANMHYRLSAEMQALKRVIEAGTLGEVRYAHVRFLRSADIPGFGSWFTRKELSGGGVLMDVGAHMLDLVLWLLGFPRVEGVACETRAMQGPKGRGLGGWGAERVEGGLFDVEDFARVRLRLEGGASATVETSWALYANHEERVQFVGDEGGADVFPELYGPEKPARLYLPRDGVSVGGPLGLPPLKDGSGRYVLGSFAEATRESTRPSPAGQEALWHASVARFARSVRDGGEPTATGREALAVQELLDAAYRSAAEGGREVRLEGAFSA